MLFSKVSGGPLYVSDHPGDHDFVLLRRLVLPDGSILRCRGGAGRPTLDCLFVDVMRDNKSLLKVSNHIAMLLQGLSHLVLMRWF